MSEDNVKEEETITGERQHPAMERYWLMAGIFREAVQGVLAGKSGDSPKEKAQHVVQYSWEVAGAAADRLIAEEANARKQAKTVPSE